MIDTLDWLRNLNKIFIKSNYKNFHKARIVYYQVVELMNLIITITTYNFASNYRLSLDNFKNLLS